MEIAWPAMPTEARMSDAIGVRRLTGMNSEAINMAAHIAIEATALHSWRLETAD
jgi:acid phosphatase family membrane protein YuiD